MIFNWPKKYFLFVFLLLLISHSAPRLIAQNTESPRVLIVIAHPDDESGFAASVYKITHFLDGIVDLALITNGEGGYKYSTLAESIYGLELTDEQVGREYLPSIRKRELMAGGEIIGIRKYFFLDEPDHEYTLNVDSVLTYVWQTDGIKQRLKKIMADGDYDYVFCLLPVPETHGHHKGATILALEAVGELPASERPVVLGVSGLSDGDTVERFTGLAEYPVTGISAGEPSFTFDRTRKFGFRNRLDYRIIVNWLIAEHKSQGTMQLGMNGSDRELFWYFDINDESKRKAAHVLFDRLNQDEAELQGREY